MLTGGRRAAAMEDQTDGGAEGVSSAVLRQGMRSKQSLGGWQGDMDMY